MTEKKVRDVGSFKNTRCPECGRQMEEVWDNKFRCKGCGVSVEFKS